MLAKSLQAAVAGQSAGGYTIERSLRFNYSDGAYLQRTLSTPTSRRIMTYSFWVKRSTTESYQTFWNNYVGSNPYGQLQLQSDKFQVYSQNSSGTPTLWLETSGVYRDFSAWYHFVIAIDTTQATASNRAKLYVNGSQVTSFGTATYPSQNSDVELQVDSRIAAIGRRADGGVTDQNLGGYLTEYYFIDGQALTPADFGEYNATTGVWQPIEYAGTYGTNGFHLDFADNTSTTTIGYDTSGNGNNWTANNFSVTAGAGNDSLVDTPTPYGEDTGVGGEIGGNYCTFNSTLPGVSANISNGNLDVTGSSCNSTIGVSSGKYYCEYTINSASVFYGPLWGFTNADYTVRAALRAASGQYASAGGLTVTLNNHTTNLTSGTLGLALDLDSGEFKVYHNNSLKLTATGIPAGTYFFMFTADSSTDSITANFGQRPFAYTAPSGFKALCTTNLPEPDVVQGDTAFNTVLWTGDSSGGGRAISNVGFQPDLVWLKTRSDAYHHQLHDVVRGATTGALYSSLTNAEDTNYPITSFDSDGFTLGTSLPDYGSQNAAGTTYVAWNWKAGGSGVSNTDGSITSTVSANPTAGFSIVTWAGNSTSGATIGHGLSSAPSLIISKIKSASADWAVYHKSIGATKYLILNTAAAATSDSAVWNNTDPTSSVFTVGNATWVNGSGYTMVSYCFAPVEGFSAMGRYIGNGSTDGPFIYTGFRPAFVLWKETSTSSYWWRIHDSTRNPYNVTDLTLYPTDASVESTNADLVDFVSNGFKIRTLDSGDNRSGSNFIYMAFAENPFKYSLAR